MSHVWHGSWRYGQVLHRTFVWRLVSSDWLLGRLHLNSETGGVRSELHVVHLVCILVVLFDRDLVGLWVCLGGLLALDFWVLINLFIFMWLLRFLDDFTLFTDLFNDWWSLFAVSSFHRALVGVNLLDGKGFQTFLLPNKVLRLHGHYLPWRLLLHYRGYLFGRLLLEFCKVIEFRNCWNVRGSCFRVWVGRRVLEADKCLPREIAVLGTSAVRRDSPGILLIGPWYRGRYSPLWCDRALVATHVKGLQLNLFTDLLLAVSLASMEFVHRVLWFILTFCLDICVANIRASSDWFSWIWKLCRIVRLLRSFERRLVWKEGGLFECRTVFHSLFVLYHVFNVQTLVLVHDHFLVLHVAVFKIPLQFIVIHVLVALHTQNPSQDPLILSIYPLGLSLLVRVVQTLGSSPGDLDIALVNNRPLPLWDLKQLAQ